MKKLLSLFVLWGMVAVGCTEGGIDDSINNEQPGDDKIPENIFFAVDKESATIASDGGSVDVVVYSNYKWEISGTSDWCTPSMKNGDANEDGQKVTFAADVAYDDREAIFWFRCADEKIKFVVSQRFKEVIIPDANNTFDVPAKGGVAVISYQTTVDCEVIIPEEAKGWISVANTRALVSENINLAVAENTTYSARTAVVKVVAKGNADLVAEYTINQAQNDAILADENKTFTVPSKGGEVVIDYQTNVDCEVMIPVEAQSWITIVPETRGLTAQSAALQIAENTTYDPRSAVIKVVAKGNSEVFAEYTINQEQNDAILADENKTFTVPCKGGEVVIDYQTNVDCEVVIPVEAKDWITVAPATRGLTAQSAKLHVAENTTYSARIAAVKIVAKDNSAVFAEYTINQEQNDGLIADGDSEFNIGGYEQQISIKHKTNTDCEVIIPVEAQDWITVAPATRGLVTYSTTLNIAENNTGEQRQAIVKVVSVDKKELFVEYNIIQSPRCFIEYTSTDGKIVKPYDAYVFGASILSNTYENGVGIIEFHSIITRIGNKAFYRCSSLTSVTIPDNVTTIGDQAFDYCKSLTSVTIPNSVSSIGDYAFSGCSSLTSVTIPDNVTTIGDQAFSNCSSLREFNGKFASDDGRCLIIDKTLNSFAPAEVTEYTIPHGVITIGTSVFSGCSSLMSVTIPNSVSSIGDYAFIYCKSLTSVTIPNSVSSIGDYAFSDCRSLTSVTIPNSVSSIGDYAFNFCMSLTSVTIPNRVSTIGECTFSFCSSLSSVTIPDRVTTIENNAFSSCESLRSITIPNRVTTIGGSAFGDCIGLESVYCKATTPPTWIDWYQVAWGNMGDIFEGSSPKIYVPTKAVSEYRSARGWSSYATSIYGYDF